MKKNAISITNSCKRTCRPILTVFSCIAECDFSSYKLSRDSGLESELPINIESKASEGESSCLDLHLCQEEIDSSGASVNPQVDTKNYTYSDASFDYVETIVVELQALFTWVHSFRVALEDSLHIPLSNRTLSPPNVLQTHRRKHQIAVGHLGSQEMSENSPKNWLPMTSIRVNIYNQKVGFQKAIRATTTIQELPHQAAAESLQMVQVTSLAQAPFAYPVGARLHHWITLEHRLSDMIRGKRHQVSDRMQLPHINNTLMPIDELADCHPLNSLKTVCPGNVDGMTSYWLRILGSLMVASNKQLHLLLELVNM